jgi:hypothetical protein
MVRIIYLIFLEIFITGSHVVYLEYMMAVIVIYYEGKNTISESNETTNKPKRLRRQTTWCLGRLLVKWLTQVESSLPARGTLWSQGTVFSCRYSF